MFSEISESRHSSQVHDGAPTQVCRSPLIYITTNALYGLVLCRYDVVNYPFPILIDFDHSQAIQEKQAQTHTKLSKANKGDVCTLATLNALRMLLIIWLSILKFLTKKRLFLTLQKVFFSQSNRQQARIDKLGVYLYTITSQLIVIVTLC